VKLYLPRFVVTPVADETIPPPAEVPHAQDHETILVVEDDVDVLAYMQESLEGLGYHVIAARDAQSALTSLETHPNIALLFTDVQLPELTGPSLAEEIERRRPGLPVLYTTAYPAMAVLHRGLLAREARTITKPFVLAELAAAVRDAIDNPRASTFH
jgi:CheY-like chemotaxis protein